MYYCLLLQWTIRLYYCLIVCNNQSKIICQLKYFESYSVNIMWQVCIGRNLVLSFHDSKLVKSWCQFTSHIFQAKVSECLRISWDSHLRSVNNIPCNCLANMIGLEKYMIRAVRPFLSSLCMIHYQTACVWYDPYKLIDHSNKSWLLESYGGHTSQCQTRIFIEHLIMRHIVL